jgi:UDP-glucose:(heptosyl)LPS alpha-1,3-glucosyltransferase
VNILLSWYDPCSRVVLEATRWGVPSITTTYNGAAEVLAQGCGIVVESPLDIQGAVAAMEKLADPSLRAQMSRKCLSASPRLSIERHVDELIRCYQEVFR